MSTTLLGDIVGATNVSVEQRVFRDHEFTAKVEASTLHVPRSVGDQDVPATYDEIDASAYLDVQSNSKWITHTRFTYAHRYNLRSEDTGVIGTVLGNATTLQSSQEYVFDNWNRLVIGPRYNFDLMTIGGYVGYIFVWDRVNVGTFMRTENFADVRFNVKKAYTVGFDLYWRF